MKKIVVILCLTLLILPLIFSQGKKEADGDKVVLTMGSWRTDDAQQMKVLLAEYNKLVPNVEIKFQPTNPPDYNATLRLQLDSNTGPDLMYARSYDTGKDLFKNGYISDVTNIPGVLENFTDASLAPWKSEDGRVFAVPFAAVSHVVYYNKDIFKQERLSIPNTWEEFLVVCNTLKARGYTPLANGVADEWDILETFFFGLIPNYIGGPKGRMMYETGLKKFNNPEIVAAFTAMRNVAQYLPKGFESVTYNDSQILFNTQKAAMFVDGSWSLGVYKDAPFDWSVFAIPAPKGNETAICFHPDMAITKNTASKHADEARDFLAWIASIEGATVASKVLPVGFFPMINFPIALAHPQANTTLALNEGKKTDARFVWPSMMDLYAPMNQAVIKVLKGEITPNQAATSLLR